MIYVVQGFLGGLTATEMSNARPLTLAPMSNPTDPAWDNSVTVVGTDANALLHANYRFTATEGATYDLVSSSYFDPYLLRIYDDAGNTVIANDEDDDGAYGFDTIHDWRAPYTGTFYVNASWNQGQYYTAYGLGIYEDISTATAPSNAGGRYMIGTSVSGFNDTINGTVGGDTILALDGNDRVDGGPGADDLNGNQGLDIVRGGAGDDTVRGGQGNDTVYGDGGNDGHVNGNLGDDIVYGGLGNDTVYGGQGSDTLLGEEGNDLISGDLGNDVMTGGAGGDWFVFRAGGGLDWVTDFSAADGDRIVLAPGSSYTLSEVSSSAIINIGPGAQIGLAGVTVAQLGDWLVFA